MLTPLENCPVPMLEAMAMARKKFPNFRCWKFNSNGIIESYNPGWSEVEINGARFIDSVWQDGITSVGRNKSLHPCKFSIDGKE